MRSHFGCFRSGPLRAGGFTLIELLVVISIVGVLATLAIVGMPRFVDRGRKVQALAEFRELAVGIAAFESDNNRPLIPYKEREAGMDTVYGNVGGDYPNGIVVSVLAGTDENLPYKAFDPFGCIGQPELKDINPKGEVYMIFKLADKNTKNGVGPDGMYYDPWGRQMMFAVNAYKSNNPNDKLVDYNEHTPGKNDSHLETQGLAEYADTKPREESYVMWSYGKDGKIGDGGPQEDRPAVFKGSDDVISWK